MQPEQSLRNSRMLLDEVYFWTTTVKDWKHLLKPDKYKQLIIDIWRDLTNKNLIKIYGFVIMPNHLHVIWEMLALNGKEMPLASFNKATAHLFIKDLKQNHTLVLPHFEVNERERKYRIWQRDPLAVLLDNKSKIEQKLDYLHSNPLQEHWQLSERSETYKWSSASFYTNNQDEFGILSDYRDRF